MAFPIVISAMIGVGLIIGTVASSLRRSFIAWTVYGAIIPIAAIPHILILRHRSEAHDWTPVRYGVPGNARQCPHCGAGVHNDAVVCRSCQTPLYGPTNAQPEQPTETPKPKPKANAREDALQFGLFDENDCPSCDDVSAATDTDEHSAAKDRLHASPRERASPYRTAAQEKKTEDTLRAADIPVEIPRSPTGFGRMAFGGIVAVLCIIVAAVVWGPALDQLRLPDIQAGIGEAVDPAPIEEKETAEGDSGVLPLPAPVPPETGDESETPAPEPDRETPDSNTAVATGDMSVDKDAETTPNADAVKTVPAVPPLEEAASVPDIAAVNPRLPELSRPLPAVSDQSAPAPETAPSERIERAAVEPGREDEPEPRKEPERHVETSSMDESSAGASGGKAAPAVPEAKTDSSMRKPAFADTIRAALDQVGDGRASNDTAGVTAVGELVRDVQHALKARGYDPGAVDGSAGYQTRAAIQKYQKNMNLKPTGEITPEILVHLGLAEEGSHDIKIGTPLGREQSER